LLRVILMKMGLDLTTHMQMVKSPTTKQNPDVVHHHAKAVIALKSPFSNVKVSTLTNKRGVAKMVCLGIEELRDKYTIELRQAHKDAIENMKALLDNLLARPCNRESYKAVSHDLHQLREMYAQANVSRPLTLAEYRAGVAAGEIHDESDLFLFMSAEEAKEFVADGRLRVSIVVPKELDPSSRSLMDVQAHLKKMAELRTIQVHDIDEPRTGGFLRPVDRPPATVVADLKQGNKVINVLDISHPTSSAIPSFVDGVPGWDLLTFSRRDSKISKLKASVANDLANSSKFQLLASRNAWSKAHIDRFGVITSVRVEYGDKLWLSWASRSVQNLRKFALSDKPVGKGFVVYLREGDTLMQPAGTPHAPYTGPYKDFCFMTGNMFTPAQNVAQQMQCLEAEAWSTYNITNEDPADETEDVLSSWEGMMRNKSTAWPWPNQDEQEVYRKSFKVGYKSDVKDNNVSNSYARHGKRSRNRSQAAPANLYAGQHVGVIKRGVVACGVTLTTV
jgi:hypothetical protein